MESDERMTDDILLGILKNFNTKDFFIAEEINSKRRKNIYAKFPIPQNETIIATVDATAFGSNKYGLAFGLNAIYVNNDITGDSYSGSISYEELNRSEIVHKGSIVFIGSLFRVNMGLPDMKPEKLVELLIQIKQRTNGIYGSFELAEDSPELMLDEQTAEEPRKKSWLERLDEKVTRKFDDAIYKGSSLDKFISKEDFARFLHLVNQENHSSFEEYQLALKDYFFDKSLEAKNFNISRHLSIGNREEKADRDPFLELFIDDINQKFIIFDLRNKNVHNFYHFNQIIDFEYDEVVNVEGAGVITTSVTHMVINVRLNAIPSSLSIPLIYEPDTAAFGIDTDNSFYLHQKKIANDIIGVFTYMKNNATIEHTSANDDHASSQHDIVDELRKFKQLQEEGLISAEDFEHKKKQLLGL